MYWSALPAAAHLTPHPQPGAASTVVDPIIARTRIHGAHARRQTQRRAGMNRQAWQSTSGARGRAGCDPPSSPTRRIDRGRSVMLDYHAACTELTAVCADSEAPLDGASRLIIGSPFGKQLTTAAQAGDSCRHYAAPEQRTWIEAVPGAPRPSVSGLLIQLNCTTQHNSAPAGWNRKE